MSFNDFLNSAWSDHAKDAVGVSTRFGDAFGLIENNDQIPLFAGLITHVMGEHLGEFQKGILNLQKLRQVQYFIPQSESENSIVRSIASLEVASGQMGSLVKLNISDQIRVLAVAASALSEKNTPRALQLFQDSLVKAKDGLAKDDPANRALAVTGNNLASALEEKRKRSESETELMILAAQTGRKFWEIAGTWLQVLRAEYRLSRTYLKAGDYGRSVEHALKSIEGAKVNNAGALDLFYGYEALALAEKAKENHDGFSSAFHQAQYYFDNLTEEDKPWCKDALAKLKG